LTGKIKERKEKKMNFIRTLRDISFISALLSTVVGMRTEQVLLIGALAMAMAVIGIANAAIAPPRLSSQS